MKKPTLIVNFLAGPGSGKSTFAHLVMGELKILGINAEFGHEYAKELVFTKRWETFKDQIYMFGKQRNIIYNKVGEVDVIVTDCPILLSPIYDTEKRSELTELVLNEYKKVPNQYNVFVKRLNKKFVEEGRIHGEKEAKKIDKEVKSFLDKNKIPYQEMECNKANVQHVVRVVFQQLGLNNDF